MAYNSNNKNNIVVVFDFDKTIIDVDSDNWVVDGLGFTDLFNQLLPTMPWNSLMVCSCFLFSAFVLIYLKKNYLIFVILRFCSYIILEFCMEP